MPSPLRRRFPDPALSLAGTSALPLSFAARPALAEGGRHRVVEQVAERLVDQLVHGDVADPAERVRQCLIGIDRARPQLAEELAESVLRLPDAVNQSRVSTVRRCGAAGRPKRRPGSVPPRGAAAAAPGRPPQLGLLPAQLASSRARASPAVAVEPTSDTVLPANRSRSRWASCACRWASDAFS